jgi:hypothetical protein
VGHFSRDCKKPKRAPKGGKGRGKGAKGFFLEGEHFTGLLESEGPREVLSAEQEFEDFLAQIPSCLLDEVCPEPAWVPEVFLKTQNELREPGKAVPDSGAGLVGIGASTLRDWEAYLKPKNLSIRDDKTATPVSLRFGNSSVCQSQRVVWIPLGFQGLYLVWVRAHVLPGGAPFLWSIELLEQLDVQASFRKCLYTSNLFNLDFSTEKATTGHHLGREPVPGGPPGGEPHAQLDGTRVGDPGRAGQERGDPGDPVQLLGRGARVARDPHGLAASGDGG